MSLEGASTPALGGAPNLSLAHEEALPFAAGMGALDTAA